MNKYLSVPLETKDGNLAPDGTFSGYASVFGEVDSYRDVVLPGAFQKSLQKWAGKNKMPSMLWQHNTREPIGVYNSMGEDSYGLKVNGQLALETVKGKEAYALLKMGAVDGLSIGYEATAWQDNTKEKTVELTTINLWEVSLVTFPAGPGARIDGVKSLLEYGNLPSLKEFEEHLREAGFSRTQAAVIAGKGLSHLHRQREAEGQKRELKLDDILSLINPR